MGPAGGRGAHELFRVAGRMSGRQAKSCSVAGTSRLPARSVHPVSTEQTHRKSGGITFPVYTFTPRLSNYLFFIHHGSCMGNCRS